LVLPDGRRVHAAKRGNRLVIRKYVLALSLIALPLGTVVASGAAANASVRPHASVTFTGSISCALSGTIKAKPALTNTASTSTIAITLGGTLSKCTGKTTQGGLTIASGTVKSTATLPKGTTCTGLLTDTPNPAGTITWKATKKGGEITATAFKLSKGTVSSTSHPDRLVRRHRWDHRRHQAEHRHAPHRVRRQRCELSHLDDWQQGQLTQTPCFTELAGLRLRQFRVCAQDRAVAAGPPWPRPAPQPAGGARDGKVGLS
jgi:hypothetical protein